MSINFELKTLTLYIYSNSNWDAVINIPVAIIFLFIIYMLFKVTCSYIRKHNPYLVNRLQDLKNKIHKRKNIWRAGYVSHERKEKSFLYYLWHALYWDY